MGDGGRACERADRRPWVTRRGIAFSAVKSTAAGDSGRPVALADLDQVFHMDVRRGSWTPGILSWAMVAPAGPRYLNVFKGGAGPLLGVCCKRDLGETSRGGKGHVGEVSAI